MNKLILQIMGVVLTLFVCVVWFTGCIHYMNGSTSDCFMGLAGMFASPMVCFNVVRLIIKQ